MQELAEQLDSCQQEDAQAQLLADEAASVVAQNMLAPDRAVSRPQQSSLDKVRVRTHKICVRSAATYLLPAIVRTLRLTIGQVCRISAFGPLRSLPMRCACMLLEARHPQAPIASWSLINNSWCVHMRRTSEASCLQMKHVPHSLKDGHLSLVIKQLFKATSITKSAQIYTCGSAA